MATRIDRLAADLDSFIDKDISLNLRTIYLGYGQEDTECDLDSVLAAKVLKSLYMLSKIDDKEPITILMNCSGGDVSSGLAIYDMIKSLPCPVYVDVFGRCDSMAAWILQAADRRRMSGLSRLMIHNGYSAQEGRKDEVKSWYKYYQEVDAVCESILLHSIRERHSKFTLRRLRKMLATDTILWPHQALNLGLIDEIIGEEGT